MPTPPKTVALGPFLGMNNKLPDTQLGTKDGAFLRSVVNGDINGAGMVQRRPGYARAISGSAARSLWATPDESLAFYADYSNLYQLNLVGGALSATQIYNGLNPAAPVSYTQTPYDVTFTDTTSILRIVNGAIYPQSLPVPPAPAATNSPGGGLVAGIYGFTITATALTGEEGGAPLPVQVTANAGDQITLTGLQANAPLISVYMTTPNGDEYYYATTVPSSRTTLTISSVPTTFGRLCHTILHTPLPPGNIVRYFNGRLLVASGNMLYYSQPWMPVMNPARGYIPFTAPITVLEPVKDGLYIVADQTYWIAGNIADAELQIKLPYGGVPGTGTQVPNEDAAFWMSPRGLVKGDQGGTVSNLQEKTNVVSSGIIGAALFRELNGMKHLIGSTFGSPPGSVFAATSWMNAEVIRKGTVL